MLKAVGNSELPTFTDSDLASCEETRKSRSGACNFYDSLIYCKSGKQNKVLLEKRIKVHNVSTEDQAADTFTTILAWPCSSASQPIKKVFIAEKK